MLMPTEPRTPRTPVICPACNGEGRVYRMTPAFEAMSQQAMGGSFGWTGQTHQWRQCHPCKGEGVLR